MAAAVSPPKPWERANGNGMRLERLAASVNLEIMDNEQRQVY